MINILGNWIKKDRLINIGLEQIFGIGTTRAQAICHQLFIGTICRFYKVKKKHIYKISYILNNRYQSQHQYQVGASLEKKLNIQLIHLLNNECYKATRHKAGLPVNGQRTKTNARTQKLVGVKRIEKLKKKK